jgi:hypothetical protein
MGNYFIKIEDGPDTRRKLLESSKGALHVLRGYQELLRVRSEKVSHMHALRQELRELTVLINRAESLLPVLTEREVEELNPKQELPKIVEKAKAIDARPRGKWVKRGNKKVFVAMPKRIEYLEVPAPALPPAPKPKAVEQPVERPVEKVVAPKHLTELERLEQQLRAVENRLGNI